MMEPDQIEQLKKSLKQKYDEINFEYQKITHLSKLDTMPKLRKKVECE